MNDVPLESRTNTAVKTRFNVKRREKCWIFAGCVIGILALLFWRPINRAVVTKLVFQSEKPAGTLVNDLVTEATDPAAFLERLWRTDKIPHRLLAITYLKEHAGSQAALLERMESLLLVAAKDGDLEVRELALDALAVQHHPELARLAKEQLGDVDPAARVLALTHLRKAGNSRLVSLVTPLLEDPEPLVAAYATLDLRSWTGEDFGARTSQVARFKQAMQRWKDWWKLHQQDYPVLSDTPAQTQQPWRLPTADFTLEDRDGKPTQLSASRGKVVLITLWDTVTTNYFREIPILNELQQRNSNRLAVLGISLDITVNERDCCADDHDHGSHPKPDLTTIRAHVQQVADKNGIKYRVLIDPTGSVGWRFNGDFLPSYILIDAEGYVRRRFTGGRNLPALEAMVNQVASQTAQK